MVVSEPHHSIFILKRPARTLPCCGENTRLVTDSHQVHCKSRVGNTGFETHTTNVPMPTSRGEKSWPRAPSLPPCRSVPRRMLLSSLSTTTSAQCHAGSEQRLFSNCRRHRQPQPSRGRNPLYVLILSCVKIGHLPCEGERGTHSKPLRMFSPIHHQRRTQ